MEKMKKQGQLQAMWFAAGTAAFMACLERAVLVSFVEQWTAVVFLALNLLLLAILFTSPSSPSISTNELELSTGQECHRSVELIEDEAMKGRKQCSIRADDHHGDGDGSHPSKVLESRSKRESQNVEEIPNNDSAHELSKEELNERVEAFIAMFRQHLVSDAKGKRRRLHSSHSGIAKRF